jgi:hypothetical protein
VSELFLLIEFPYKGGPYGKENLLKQKWIITPRFTTFVVLNKNNMIAKPVSNKNGFHFCWIFCPTKIENNFEDSIT